MKKQSLSFWDFLVSELEKSFGNLLQEEEKGLPDFDDDDRDQEWADMWLWRELGDYLDWWEKNFATR